MSLCVSLSVCLSLTLCLCLRVSVRAYSHGEYYFCEVDVIMDKDTPFSVAHDVGEALQNKLERLPEIERAFVHLDYSAEHEPEHGAALQRTFSGGSQRA